jgi:hypothetical protein
LFASCREGHLLLRRHYAPRWRKDPFPGWSRVSQIWEIITFLHKGGGLVLPI